MFCYCFKSPQLTLVNLFFVYKRLYFCTRYKEKNFHSLQSSLALLQALKRISFVCLKLNRIRLEICPQSSSRPKLVNLMLFLFYFYLFLMVASSLSTLCRTKAAFPRLALQLLSPLPVVSAHLHPLMD